MRRRFWKVGQHAAVLVRNVFDAAVCWARDWRWRSQYLDHEWRMRELGEVDCADLEEN